MADPLQDLRTRLQQEAAEADRQLLESIRVAKTEEGLREEWDRWRGSVGRAGPKRAGWGKELSELWVALSSARISQRAAYATAVVLILLVGWWQLMPDQRSFRTPRADVSTARLPTTLRVNIRSGKSTLVDPGRTLLALLDSPRRGAGGVSTFEVDYSGTDAQGSRVLFKGSMLVTNVVGVGTLTSDKDIAGVLLKGDLTVGNQPTTPIRQSFVR